MRGDNGERQGMTGDDGGQLGMVGDNGGRHNVVHPGLWVLLVGQAQKMTEWDDTRLSMLILA